MIRRYRQLVRVLQLRRVIGHRQCVHIDALAAEFKVTTRTIRRDLAALREAGEHVPVCVEVDIIGQQGSRA